GGAIAPFVLGQLSLALGWRQAFWVLGAIGVLWCWAFHAWFRNTPEKKLGCNAAERALIGSAPARRAYQEGQASSASEPTGRLGQPPWRVLVRSLSIWALCVASAGVSFGWYFYPTWQPEYLQNVFHINYQGSEIVTGLPFLCGALGCLVGGGLSDWLMRRTGSRCRSRRLMGMVGFGGAGICVLLTGFASAAWQAVALLCLAFLINDLAIPAIWATSADIGGRYAGTVAGIMNMAGAAGGVVSPILIPLALMALPESYDVAVRWRTIFIGLAISWFVAALAWLFIDADRQLFPMLPPLAQDVPEAQR
ncbi:MAG TPA: MFS transporter, partial [Gemmataceae bacterium]|nr:MFS transporter [Gemmataceae bacterium]